MLFLIGDFIATHGSQLRTRCAAYDDIQLLLLWDDVSWQYCFLLHNYIVLHLHLNLVPRIYDDLFYVYHCIRIFWMFSIALEMMKRNHYICQRRTSLEYMIHSRYMRDECQHILFERFSEACWMTCVISHLLGLVWWVVTIKYCACDIWEYYDGLCQWHSLRWSTRSLYALGRLINISRLMSCYKHLMYNIIILTSS